MLRYTAISTPLKEKILADQAAGWKNPYRCENTQALRRQQTDFGKIASRGPVSLFQEETVKVRFAQMTARSQNAGVQRFPVMLLHVSDCRGGHGRRVLYAVRQLVKSTDKVADRPDAAHPGRGVR